jgi:hypothetical protein
MQMTQNGFQTQGHEHNNEASGSIKSGKYIDQLSNYKADPSGRAV